MKNKAKIFLIFVLFLFTTGCSNQEIKQEIISEDVDTPEVEVTEELNTEIVPEDIIEYQDIESKNISEMEPIELYIKATDFSKFDSFSIDYSRITKSENNPDGAGIYITSIANENVRYTKIKDEVLTEEMGSDSEYENWYELSYNRDSEINTYYETGFFKMMNLDEWAKNKETTSMSTYINPSIGEIILFPSGATVLEMNKDIIKVQWNIVDFYGMEVEGSVNGEIKVNLETGQFIAANLEVSIPNLDGEEYSESINFNIYDINKSNELIIPENIRTTAKWIDDIVSENKN